MSSESGGFLSEDGSPWVLCQAPTLSVDLWFFFKKIGTVKNIFEVK